MDGAAPPLGRPPATRSAAAGLKRAAELRHVVHCIRRRVRVIWKRARSGAECPDPDDRLAHRATTGSSCFFLFPYMMRSGSTWLQPSGRGFAKSGHHHASMQSGRPLIGALSFSLFPPAMMIISSHRLSYASGSCLPDLSTLTTSLLPSKKKY